MIVSGAVAQALSSVHIVLYIARERNNRWKFISVDIVENRLYLNSSVYCSQRAHREISGTRERVFEGILYLTAKQGFTFIFISQSLDTSGAYLVSTADLAYFRETARKARTVFPLFLGGDLNCVTDGETDPRLNMYLYIALGCQIGEFQEP